jgi:pectin methylesterase-like acyl-CoA thioesterase
MADDPTAYGTSAPASNFAAKLSNFGGAQAVKANAAQLSANTVRIDPGGATFPTIGQAIASITDASQQKEYLLTIGPGTYNEQVTLKPFVYLDGAGAGQTIITNPPTQDAFSRGTVIAASNSGIGDMTVTCEGGSWGDWSTAVVIGGCTPFYADNVQMVCDDQNNAGINIETCAVNWNSEGQGPSQVYISYSSVTANAQSGQSSGLALIASGLNAACNVECIESKFVATGGANPIGAYSNYNSNITFDNCYIEGAYFALDLSDAAITANNCQINGPVQNGVVINNNTPPSE